MSRNLADADRQRRRAGFVGALIDAVEHLADHFDTLDLAFGGALAPSDLDRRDAGLVHALHGAQAAGAERVAFIGGRETTAEAIPQPAFVIGVVLRVPAQQAGGQRLPGRILITHCIAVDADRPAQTRRQVHGVAQPFLEDAAVVEDKGFDLDVGRGARHALDLGERHVARQDHPAHAKIAQQRDGCGIAAIGHRTGVDRQIRHLVVQGGDQRQVGDDHRIAAHAMKARRDIDQRAVKILAVVLRVEHQKQLAGTGMRGLYRLFERRVVRQVAEIAAIHRAGVEARHPVRRHDAAVQLVGPGLQQQGDLLQTADRRSDFHSDESTRRDTRLSRTASAAAASSAAS